MSRGLVTSKQNNSYRGLSGYEEVNERHACLGSSTTALRRAGRGDFCPYSLTLGSRRYDSRRGGVEGHRPVCGGGCFCLWKRGRKRRPMPPRDARCSLTHFCSGSKKPPAGALAAPGRASEFTSRPGADLAPRPGRPLPPPGLPSQNAPSLLRYYKRVRFLKVKALL